jgi:hypothetical protein
MTKPKKLAKAVSLRSTLDDDELALLRIRLKRFAAQFDGLPRDMSLEGARLLRPDNRTFRMDRLRDGGGTRLWVDPDDRSSPFSVDDVSVESVEDVGTLLSVIRLWRSELSLPSRRLWAGSGEPDPMKVHAMTAAETFAAHDPSLGGSTVAMHLPTRAKPGGSILLLGARKVDPYGTKGVRRPGSRLDPDIEQTVLDHVPVCAFVSEQDSGRNAFVFDAGWPVHANVPKDLDIVTRMRVLTRDKAIARAIRKA